MRILQEVSAADKERDASMGAFRQQCFDAVHKLNSLLQKQEPVSKIESIIGDLSAYGRPPENEETAVAAGTYCSQLKMPRMFGLTGLFDSMACPFRSMNLLPYNYSQQEGQGVC